MSGHPKLLLVDDDAQKRSLIAHYVALEFPAATFVECASGAEAIEQLLAGTFDAVITNHSIHPIDGVELIRWIRAHLPQFPVIMVTGNPQVAGEAIEAGVDRVLDTSAYKSIGEIVRRQLEKNRPPK
jgi:CheY-like chemotaxis protein